MSQLTDEQQMLKENAERFLEREAVPFIAKAEKGGEFPWQLLPKLGSSAISARCCRTKTAGRAPATPT